MDISNEFQKTKAAIATEGCNLLALVPHRVRVDAPGRDGTVPSVPEPATQIDAAAADDADGGGGVSSLVSGKGSALRGEPKYMDRDPP